MKKHFVYVLAILLAVACLATFGRIMGNHFINFDDPGYLTKNYQVQSGLNTQSVKWAFSTTHLSYWHPLTWLSHMLDWQLFGAHAAGHHLMSLFFHIGTVIFLFLFLSKTTRQIWLSAFAAAFFALHPLRVESVAWASERKDVLSMFFGMASLYAYAFYAESRKRSKYVLCLLLFALSLMSKPMLVTLPFVLLLLDVWPLKRADLASPPATLLKTAGGLIREKIPFFVLTILISVVTVWAQSKDGVIASADAIPFSARLANAAVSYASYLLKTFWPTNLAVYYPYDFALPWGSVALAAAVVGIVTAAVLFKAGALPFLPVGWFWYLGTLIPVIGFVQVGSQAMADRYTYLPSIGIAIMLAWGIPSFLPHAQIRKRILWPAATAVLVILACLTFVQCGYWKNSFTLFGHALRTTQNSATVHNNFGLALLEKNLPAQAVEHLTQAIALKKDDAFAYNNRGNAYAAMNRFPQAMDDFHQAIALRPDYAEAFYNLGTLYGRLGRQSPAVENLSAAIRIKPDYADAYNNRAFVYLSAGQNDIGCLDAKKACALGNCKIWKSPVAEKLCR